MYSEWCLSVCYQSAENKTKTKLFDRTLVMSKYPILCEDMRYKHLCLLSLCLCFLLGCWCCKFTIKVSNVNWNTMWHVNDEVPIHNERIGEWLNINVSVADWTYLIAILHCMIQGKVLAVVESWLPYTCVTVKWHFLLSPFTFLLEQCAQYFITFLSYSLGTFCSKYFLPIFQSLCYRNSRSDNVGRFDDHWFMLYRWKLFTREISKIQKYNFLHFKLSFGNNSGQLCLHLSF